MLRLLLCFATLVLLPTTGFSAEIKKISEKSSAVLIDEGEETGFSKGKKVCIFDGEKKVACGKVAKAVKKKAFVRVSKKKIDSMKIGFTVSLAEETDKDKEAASDKTDSSKSPYSMSIGLMLHFMPITPSVYEKLEYVPDQAGNTSYWQDDGGSSSLLIPPAFGLEFEMINWGLILGARYGVFPESSIESSGSTIDANSLATTDITATDIGVYLDYVYYRRWGVNFAAGLDIDQTSLSFNSTLDESTTGASTDNYDATSSIMTYSLRLPFIYKYAFGHFGLSAAVDLLLPLFASGPTQSVSNAPDLQATPPTQNTKVPVDDSTDLTDSLAQKKNSFAADLVIGVFFQF